MGRGRELALCRITLKDFSRIMSHDNEQATMAGSTAVPDEPVKILLVDDRSENLLALDAVLSRPDYRLIKARSGEEALKQLLKNDFAVILLDVQMPGMDGYETAAMIRQRARSRATPIIFVTAVYGEARHIGRGYEAGAVDYIIKPFEPAIM